MFGGPDATAYLLALRFDLLPPPQRAAASRYLVDRISNRQWHLSTGFLGVNLLLPTLTDIGRSDVAYRLIENRTYPSWGYSIVNGATTCWERWNSYMAGGAGGAVAKFGDVGMNSFNHYAYGSAGQWMYGTLAGIDTDGPGFKKIRIRPEPGGALTFAKAAYQSIQGRIESAWRIEDGWLTMDLTIPANTTATVYVPTQEADRVTEGGQAATQAQGVKFLRQDGNTAVYEVVSGSYAFRAPWDSARKTGNSTGIATKGSS